MSVFSRLVLVLGVAAIASTGCGKSPVERVSCEANQRHYAAEAASARDCTAVSPCTEAL